MFRVIVWIQRGRSGACRNRQKSGGHFRSILEGDRHPLALADAQVIQLLDRSGNQRTKLTVAQWLQTRRRNGCRVFLAQRQQLCHRFEVPHLFSIDLAYLGPTESRGPSRELQK